MTKEEHIIISIGSNYNQRQNIEYAKEKLRAIFGKETEFSAAVWTKPIGIKSEDFLNCLCFSSTSHTVPQLTRAFKQIERKCDRTKKNDIVGKITLDIDILMYGETKYNEEDWDKEYIKQLLDGYTSYNVEKDF